MDKTQQSGQYEFTHRLPNGMEMVGQYMPSVRSVALGIQIDAGSMHEQNNVTNGVAHLIEYNLFQGTTSRTARQINDELERIGAQHGSGVNAEWARYTASLVGRGDNLNRTLDILADVLMNPTFPEQEWEQQRAIVQQEIRNRDDEPMQRVFDVLREDFFNGNPLGYNPLGKLETVMNLTPDQARQFWSEYYHPNNMLLSVAGSFDWDDLVKRVESLFGGWHTGENLPSRYELQKEIPPPNPQTKISVEQYESQQEHIGMAYQSVPITSPYYYVASVVTEIFGGGMSSRLFSEVREKRGLVYSVGASYGATRPVGLVSIYAGTTSEKSPETVQVIIDQLQKLYDKGVTDEELNDAKTQIKARVVMRGESSGARMGANMSSWWYENRLRPIHEIKEQIDAVTHESIKEYLATTPPFNAFVLSARGPRPQPELLAGVPTELLKA